MLKRKNEDSEDGLSKRVAMDAHMMDQNEQETSQSSLADPPSSTPARPTPISSHKVSSTDDPTTVHFRMLCPVKEAGLIVGKGGEKINYLKGKSGARINVSENIPGVYERVIHVKGPAEKVAKAFGLITRVILDEPETPSAPTSKQYVLQLLVPHPLIGFIIGKGGSKFRDIEEKSAAKLKASESTMPFSTDRCLLITGVPDAIHIATYYVAQTIYENKKFQAENRPNFVFYNPGSLGYGMYRQQFPQFGFPQPPVTFPAGQPSFPQPQGPYNQPYGMMGVPMGMGYPPIRPGRGLRAYGQQYPISKLLQVGPVNVNHIMYSPGQTDPNPPVAPGPNFMPQPSSASPENKDIYISNDFVGSVIGKGGKNIKEIRDLSGSQIKVQDPDDLLNGVRKIIITGPVENNNMAIYLINNRIEMDRQKNREKGS